MCSRLFKKTLTRRRSIVVVCLLRSLNKLFYCFVVLIAVFDKQVNIRCSIGSISRLTSSHNHNAADQAIAMDSSQSYFKELDIYFCGSLIYSLFLYYFCMVVTILKAATSLSVISTSRPSLAQ